MKCKPGDLAVFTSCILPENLGRLVSVLVQCKCASHSGRAVWKCTAMQSVFAMDRDSETVHEIPAGTNFCVPDDSLRPLRDNNGKDETLTWDVEYNAETVH